MERPKQRPRKRSGWRLIPAAQWLTLLGLSLMALKAAFELAKAVLALLQ